MHYEINVAKRTGRKNWRNEDEYAHFFATHERSLTTKGEAKKVWNEFREKFPYPEYLLSATQWERTGKPVNFDSDENNG